MRAMEVAIKKAKQTGSAVVGVRNSNHYGAAAYFAMMALPEDMIGFSMTVGGSNIMAPTGGITPLLGNNPFAIAVPAGQDCPLVLDMANSVVARGKIVLAMKKGEQDSGRVGNGQARGAHKRRQGGLRRAGAAGRWLQRLRDGFHGGSTSRRAHRCRGRQRRDQLLRRLRAPSERGAPDGRLIYRFLPVEQFKARIDSFIQELKDSEVGARRG